MTSTLGGTGYANFVLPVISIEASNTISRGMVCAISVAASNPAATFLDSTFNKDYQAGGGVPGTVRQIDIPLLQVVRGAVDTTAQGNFNLGIAKHDILPGKTGEIIVQGMARVLANGAITVSEVISSAAAGKVLDASSGSHGNPFGMMLEAVSAGDATSLTLRWALVNFLNSFSNAAYQAAYTQTLKFMGKSY